MTISCRDTAAIPKSANAGMIVSHNGRDVQVMHEGTLVRAGGYEGEWMAGIIRELRGHHEPQEELLFHHLLGHVRPGSLMVELGSYWAYYTNWYLGTVPGARAICVEPDPAHLELGRRNLALNDRQADFIRALVGRPSIAGREKPIAPAIDCLDMDALLARAGGAAIEMLHMDVQGVELPFIQSMRRAVEAARVRFCVVSTHHQSISGSPTTHQDCVAALTELGATVLAEHEVYESYSGDGLIVVSFESRDASIRMPAISRNVSEKSLSTFAAPQALKPARSFRKRLSANGGRRGA